MLMKESLKNGICYMRTSSCPSLIFVNDGLATKIRRVNKLSGAYCPRFDAQFDFYHPELRLFGGINRL